MRSYNIVTNLTSLHKTCVIFWYKRLNHTSNITEGVISSAISNMMQNFLWISKPVLALIIIVSTKPKARVFVLPLVLVHYTWYMTKAVSLPVYVHTFDTGIA